jgi:hypothetical protein
MDNEDSVVHFSEPPPSGRQSPVPQLPQAVPQSRAASLCIEEMDFDTSPEGMLECY